MKKLLYSGFTTLMMLLAFMGVGKAQTTVAFSPDPSAGPVDEGTTITITVTPSMAPGNVYFKRYANLATAQAQAHDDFYKVNDVYTLANPSSLLQVTDNGTAFAVAIYDWDASDPVVILDYAEYTIAGGETPEPTTPAVPLTFKPGTGTEVDNNKVILIQTDDPAELYYKLYASLEAAQADDDSWADKANLIEYTGASTAPKITENNTVIKAAAWLTDKWDVFSYAEYSIKAVETVPNYMLAFSPDNDNNVEAGAFITITPTPALANNHSIYYQFYTTAEAAEDAVWAEGDMWPEDVNLYNSQTMPQITNEKPVLRAVVYNRNTKTWITSSKIVKAYTISQTREPFVISFDPEAGEVKANTTVTLSTTPALTDGFALYYELFASESEAKGAVWTSGTEDAPDWGTMTAYTAARKPIITEANPVLRTAVWNATTHLWESDTVVVYTVPQTINPTKPAAPEFSVAAGAVDSNSTVTIAKGTADSIFVAFGKTATEAVAFAKYTANLTVTIVKDTVIRAYAMKDGLYSDTITRAYTLKPAVVPTPDTVKMPTFSVVAGEVEKGTKVTLACATEGAKIYYTVNGDAPTAQSTEYTAEIAIDSAMTIKAIAIKEGMENSKVAEAAYTIKTVANEDAELAGVRLYPNPNNGEFNVSVPVRVQVEVFTVNGTLVKALTIAQGNTPIRLKNSGIYFVRFTAENGQATVKRVIVR